MVLRKESRMTRQFWLELGLPTRGRFRVDNMRTSTLRALGRAIGQHYEALELHSHIAWKGPARLTTEVSAKSYGGLWDENREDLGEVISIAEHSGEKLRLIIYAEKLDLEKLPEILFRFKEVLERLELL